MRAIECFWTTMRLGHQTTFLGPSKVVTLGTAQTALHFKMELRSLLQKMHLPRIPRGIYSRHHHSHRADNHWPSQATRMVWCFIVGKTWLTHLRPGPTLENSPELFSILEAYCIATRTQTDYCRTFWLRVKLARLILPLPKTSGISRKTTYKLNWVHRCQWLTRMSEGNEGTRMKECIISLSTNTRKNKRQIQIFSSFME